jgi:FMN phosphatase YigB (HAD superfamily)
VNKGIDAMDAQQHLALPQQSFPAVPIVPPSAPSGPPVSALIFDLCGVMYDDTVWRRWLLRVISRMGLHTHYTLYFRVWERDYLAEVKRGRLEFWEALRLFLLSSGLTSAQIDEVGAAAHAQRRQCEQDIMPLPGVRKTLSQLTDRGVQLLLLSNSCLPYREIQQRLKKLRLANHFDAVLSTFDLGKRFSNADCFRLAIQRLQRDPREIGYVGRDSLALVEAATIGMYTVAFNNDDDAQADAFIRSFAELLEALPLRKSHCISN